MAAAARFAAGCEALLLKSTPVRSPSRGFVRIGAANVGFGFRRQQQQQQQQRGFQIVAAAKRLLSELKNIRDEADAGPVEFDSELSIVLYPDPKLRANNIRVNSYDDKLKELVEKMFDIMYRTDGVGLSAPQVGVNARVLVFNPEGIKGKGQEYVFVNPTIIRHSKQRAIDVEGCLSFYSIRANVERPETIRVEAHDINGKKFAMTFNGWLSRIFQHEYDHLRGVLYIDRMTPEVLNTIGKQLLDLEAEYEKKSGNSRPETVKDKLLSSVAS